MSRFLLFFAFILALAALLLVIGSPVHAQQNGQLGVQCFSAGNIGNFVSGIMPCTFNWTNLPASARNLAFVAFFSTPAMVGSQGSISAGQISAQINSSTFTPCNLILGTSSVGPFAPIPNSCGVLWADYNDAGLTGATGSQQVILRLEMPNSPPPGNYTGNLLVQGFEW